MITTIFHHNIRNSPKKTRKAHSFSIQHIFELLHTKFQIKIQKIELENSDKAQEQCTFLLETLWKNKKNASFSFYYAVAVLWTIFLRHSSRTLSRDILRQCIWFLCNLSILGQLLWERLEFYFLQQFQTSFSSFFFIMVNGRKTHICVEEKIKKAFKIIAK